MKYIYLLLFIPALFGCSNHLDKSIAEPLTLEEIKKSMDEDTLFKPLYAAISVIKEKHMTTDVEKEKYMDLTYSRLLDFMKSSLQPDTYENLEKEWNGKYAGVRTKVDSILNYWKKYKAENSIERFVKVELDSVYVEHISGTNTAKNCFFVFKISPLQGKVADVFFSYYISPKREAKIPDLKLGEIMKPFEKVIYYNSEVDSEYSSFFLGKSLKDFLNENNILIEIDEVTIGSNTMTDEKLIIPEKISDHLRQEKKGQFKDLYVDDIVKEFLGVEYVSKSTYISKRINEIARQKDPLAFDFFELQYKKGQGSEKE